MPRIKLIYLFTHLEIGAEIEEIDRGMEQSSMPIELSSWYQKSTMIDNLIIHPSYYNSLGIMKRLYSTTLIDIQVSFLKKTRPEALLEASFDRIGLPYTSQKSIAGVILVDIFIEPDLCIFVDGDYWHNYPIGLEKDQRQTRLLESWGYKVIRIWEHEIINNSELIVIKLIREFNLAIRNNLEEFFIE